MAEKLRRIGSNLAKIDSTEGIPDEEIPEATREDFARATFRVRGIVRRGPIKRGRPPGSGKKAPIHVRIDKDILAHFRATGRGWQTRLNDALRGVVDRKRRMSPKAKKVNRGTIGAVRRSA